MEVILSFVYYSVYSLPNFHKTLRFCQVQCLDIWTERSMREKRQREDRKNREGRKGLNHAQTGSKKII